MENQLQSLLVGFRKSHQGKFLVPAESAFSLPIPVRRGGRAFVVVLVYGTTRSPDGNGLIVLAPELAITLTYPDGMLARLEHLSCLQVLGEKTPASGSPIGLFPHPSVASLNTAQYAARRLQFLQFTESILQTREVHPDYKRLFGLLLEPSLAPYYWYYAPKFIREFMSCTETAN